MNSNQIEVYELLDLELLSNKFHLYEDFVSVVADDTELEYVASSTNEIKYDANHIPLGNTKEEIKMREKVIKDFYAHWIEQNPSKKVYNEYLKAFIHVKFISINETFAKAARNYESTCAVMMLDEILKSAVLISEVPAKRNNNQKAYEKMLLMKALEKIKLTVGLQRSTQEYVQYCVTAPAEK